MDGKIILRKGILSDLNDILAMEKICFGKDSFTRKQIIYLMLHSKGFFYVGEIAQKVVAYISLLNCPRYNSLRIYSIAVHPDAQGKKLGQLLMDQAIELARQLQANKITLEVNVSNSAAIHLYQKYQFETQSIKPHYYHDGSDAYYMVRNLSAI